MLYILPDWMLSLKRVSNNKLSNYSPNMILASDYFFNSVGASKRHKKPPNAARFSE